MALSIMTGPKELLSDLRSPQLIAAMIQGLIIGILFVIVEISFANIIFSGELSHLATRAAGLCIFGTGVFCLTTCFFSSYRTLVSGPADIPVPILSLTAAAIAASLPTASSEIIFVTVVAAMVSSAFLSALFFWLIGNFRVSNFARFLPYPVIGGFLAGGGVLMMLGSFGVMTDRALSYDAMSALMTMEKFIHWGPGIFFASCVFGILRLKSHFLILPMAILAGILLFFLITFSLGIPLDQLRNEEWLPAQLPAGQLWPGVTLATTQLINWPVLLTQLPNILTICLLSLIGMILNINGIELGSRQDIDLDRELKVEAFGNLFSGLGGGFSGYATLSMSLLGPRSGTNSRIIPLTTALVCLFIVFAGAEILNFIPKPLLGGLIFLMGLFFVDEWIFNAWKRLTLTDFLIVVSIVLTIINQGLLVGVGLGLILTTVIFLVRFTRIPVIQRTETLVTRHSMQQRSIPDRVLLDRTGHECILLTLSGYLFFGSTYFIGTKVKELLEQETPLNSLILDLTLIQGFDVSAINTLQRIAQQSMLRNVRIVLASPPDGLMTQIERNASAKELQQLIPFPHLDEALESSEEHLLSGYRDVHNNNSTDSLDAINNLFDAAVNDLDAHLQEQERFELLLEKMEQYLEHRTLADKGILFQQGQTQQSLVFILWGTVSLMMTEDGGIRRKLASMGAGKIIASKAAWGPWVADYTAQAEHQAMIATISNEAIQAMEKEVPEVALALYKHMAEAFVSENEVSKKHGR